MTTRRGFLKAIAALPAVALFGREALKPEPKLVTFRQPTSHISWQGFALNSNGTWEHTCAGCSCGERCTYEAMA